MTVNLFLAVQCSSLIKGTLELCSIDVCPSKNKYLGDCPADKLVVGHGAFDISKE